ncbi:MAG: hypothetical protein J4469_04815 [Candidatus Aenigmarchaeota archaeon]|nr:hypothetical protein [Candidatus Aenigmarchaeota archaeon]
MKIEIIENEKEKIKIEVPDVTLVNLLNENVWKEKIDFAAYNIEHTYLSKPVLVVKSKNPKKTVVDATERIIEDVKALRKQFNATLK